MNTQQNQNETKKKGVQVNPSRDMKYEEKKKDFTAELENEEGEQLDADGADEVDTTRPDKGEVELDRGGVEFSGGKEQQQNSEKNSDAGMSSDLGGDMTRTSGQAKGSDLGSRQGTQKIANQNVKQTQDNSRIQ